MFIHQRHRGYNSTVNPNGNSAAHKFKYNGVEFEEALGLNLYEMDVLMYDPAIARFNGIDPVVHHWQGTSVVFDNNPIFYADPSGADGISSAADIQNLAGSGTGEFYGRQKKVKNKNLAKNPEENSKNNSDCPEGQVCIGGIGGYENQLNEVVVRAKTNNKSNYEYTAADRKMLEFLKTALRSLYASIKYNNQRGIYYPLTGGKWGHFGVVWQAGWESDLYDDTGLADFWANFAGVTIGGTLALATVASTRMLGTMSGFGDTMIDGGVRGYMYLQSGYTATTATVSTISARFIVGNQSWLNKGNWWRLGPGFNPNIGAVNIRLAWGAHPNHLNRVPSFLQSINKALRAYKRRTFTFS